MTDLLYEGYTLKQEIDQKTARLREINKALADQAEYKGKTGHILNGKIKAKISLRENVKWDQEKLEEAKRFLPIFPIVFKAEYKPKSTKALETAMHDENFKNAIEW